MEAMRSNEGTSFTSSTGPVRKTVYFLSMSLEKLRELAKWPDGSRAQILAWCHNRYPCGCMYIIEENPSVQF